MVADFGLAFGAEVTLHDAQTLAGRDKHAAFAAVYFGGAEHPDLEAARRVVQTSAPIIPTIGPGVGFGAAVPEFLQAVNGLRRRADDPEMSELAAAMLECVGLLRRQRRVFVSYRRVESRAAALQLHDLLTARGFDVFLDTHDIRPGDPFQDVLWHRLVDSDVMVMLDTPTYFDSRWTRQEIGRARAKEIQVLRVIWPEHTPSKLTDLSETIYLEPAELKGRDGPIVEATADAIVLGVERRRSRSIAARYMSITGKLRADVEKIGASIEGIGAHRAIAVRLLDDRRIWAYPVVGVPTAEILNDVAEKARRADQRETPVLVYDHIGIRDTWSTTNPRLALAAFGVTAALNAPRHRDSESLLSDFFTDLQLAMSEFDYPEVLRPELRARVQTVLTAAGEASERHHNVPLTKRSLRSWPSLTTPGFWRGRSPAKCGATWRRTTTTGRSVTLRDAEGTALASYRWRQGAFEAV